MRLPRDLVGLDALILPGGESTTMRRLIDTYGLREPIAALARAGAPMLGTCAGMILLADRLADGEDPYFGMLDVEVERNGYGRQLDSFEADLDMPALGEAPLHGVFIRAPVVVDAGRGGRGAGARPGRDPSPCARAASSPPPSIPSSPAIGASIGSCWRWWSGGETTGGPRERTIRSARLTDRQALADLSRRVHASHDAHRRSLGVPAPTTTRLESASRR